MCFKELIDDASVEEGHKGQLQRINLDNCLQAFTMEEELGSDELYHCGKCKKPQLAKKKLDIWRLPPILVRLSARVCFIFQCLKHGKCLLLIPFFAPGFDKQASVGFKTHFLINAEATWREG